MPKPAGTKSKSKAEFPLEVTVKGVPGISAKIYRQARKKGEATYVSFILAYSLLGKRKLEAYSELDEANRAGEDAILRIAEGQQDILQLNNRERDAYVRSKEFLAPFNVDLETACRVYAELRTILNGTGSPEEAARY